MAYYQTQSAVLFVIFNRPETTKRVFEAIRQARPKRLYVVADGPRPDHPGDVVLCLQTREIVTEIDWPCDLKTLYRDNNAGCKAGVSAGINWFFEHEEDGIILEDDCLPANGFFKFCDVMLDRYRNDARIWHITGCNLQFGQKWGTASYYFSNRCHVWGWAGWKRVWQAYDVRLSNYTDADVSQAIQNIYCDELVAEAWTNIFREAKADKINSWAYPLDFTIFLNHGLVIIPNSNLISNIGFDANATHTLSNESVYSRIPLSELNDIIHPITFVPQKEADLSIINRDFDILSKRKKRNRWHRKLKRWFSGIVQKLFNITNRLH